MWSRLSSQKALPAARRLSERSRTQKIPVAATSNDKFSTLFALLRAVFQRMPRPDVFHADLLRFARIVSRSPLFWAEKAPERIKEGVKFEKQWRHVFHRRGICFRIDPSQRDYNGEDYFVQKIRFTKTFQIHSGLAFDVMITSFS